MKSKNRQETPEKKSVSRVDVIDALRNSLIKIPYVQAFWEGGAAAWDRIDEWSDIDAYLLVQDGKVEKAFESVETVLKTLSPIKQKYVVAKSPEPGVSQAFYRLECASEYLVLDLAILTRSSSTMYLELEIHGRSIFYLNKKGIDETPRVDRKSFEKKSRDDMKAMRERFQMFSNFVEKEIKRGNGLEALEWYRTIIIPSLIQVLRAKHTPMHYDFRMRYIDYELPKDVVRKLEDLCFVSGLKDLDLKNARAIRWFNEVLP